MIISSYYYNSSQQSITVDLIIIEKNSGISLQWMILLSSVGILFCS